MGESWRQGLLERIHGIAISLACKSFGRETLETSMFVGKSGGIGMMSNINIYINITQTKKKKLQDKDIVYRWRRKGRCEKQDRDF